MEDDYPAIIMDWAFGGSLYNLINSESPVDHDKIQIVCTPKDLPMSHLTQKF